MYRKSIAILIVFGLAQVLGCQATTTGSGHAGDHEVTLPDPETDGKTGFIRFYQPVPYEAPGSIEPYTLPLAEDQISNYDSVVSKLGLQAGATDTLLSRGFVVKPNGPEEDITEVYRNLKDLDVPVFVTADTWLHLYHVQFDEILKELEETVFYPDIVAVTDRLYKSAADLYGSSTGLLREAARRNMAFLRVARELMTVSDDPPTAPEVALHPDIEEVVSAELALIEAHGGFSQSPLFGYKDDYSQYVPRGHYTRSELLKSYFKALMWYGRMTMLLKGGEPACEYDTCPALIPPEEADIQTLQALLLTVDLQVLKTGDRGLASLWGQIYRVTSFFVGLSDDLTLFEYHQALVDALGKVFKLADLALPQILFDLRVELAQKRSPQIYGGTGGQVIVVQPGEEITPDMLDALLDKSKGFRFMGQRFIPDSYAMGKLVSPGAGQLDGTSDAFTAVLSPAGWIRGFPRGLDVMALLGSSRARALLAQLGDDAYTKYADSFGELETFFANLAPEDWHRNLYWGWLFALKPLLAEPIQGTQSFMQTETWQDKSLNTALASWAELRHDTILYAKQSYTPGFDTSVDPPPPEPPGYVEPNPEFFSRLLALNNMTIDGLEDLGVLNDEARRRLEALSGFLERMLGISVKELRAEELDPADHDLLRNLGDNLDAVLGGVEPAGVKTTMVADVHTDQNSQKVLEEGVGHVELIVVVLRQPDGSLTANAGPVLSYYEFKHPMNDRLTDEKWREMLEGGNAPEQPPWTATYRAP